MTVAISYEQLREMIRIAEPTAQPRDWIINGLVDNWDLAVERGIAVNDLRVSHYLSQISVETGHWRTMVEYGSDSYFSRYDGRTDLGNTQPGDGARFKGRYYIQLTGRNNYTFYSQKTGIPYVDHPDRYAEPDHVREAVLASVAYWDDPTSAKGGHKTINRFADGDHPIDVENVTRSVNGGMNGYNERLNYYRAARQIWNEHPAGEPWLPPTEPEPVPPAEESPDEIAEVIFAETKASQVRIQQGQPPVIIYNRPSDV